MARLPGNRLAGYAAAQMLPTAARIDYETRLASRLAMDDWLADPFGELFRQEPAGQQAQYLAQAGQQALGMWAPEYLQQQQQLAQVEEETMRRRGDILYYEARNRSEALLRRHLTDPQIQQLGQYGWFEVVGRTRRLCRWKKHLFRIHQHGLVYEHSPAGRRHHCITTLFRELPEADWMLMVKMLIEANCQKFFAIAKPTRWSLS